MAPQFKLGAQQYINSVGRRATFEPSKNTWAKIKVVALDWFKLKLTILWKNCLESYTD